MTVLYVLAGAVLVAVPAVWVLVKLAQAKSRAETERDAARSAVDESEDFRKVEADVGRVDSGDARGELRQWGRD